MAPYTLTFDEIGLNAPSAAGLIGRPRALPTKNGWAAGCGCGGCCATNEPAPIPIHNDAAAPVAQVIPFIGLLLVDVGRPFPAWPSREYSGPAPTPRSCG